MCHVTSGLTSWCGGRGRRKEVRRERLTQLHRKLGSERVVLAPAALELDPTLSSTYNPGRALL
jgi:hypothetical protein